MNTLSKPNTYTNFDLEKLALQKLLLHRVKGVENLILKSDAYKYTHWKVYPENTEKLQSYLEARGTTHPNMTNTMFFGLQIYLKEYIEDITIEQWMIDEAKIFCRKVFGYDYFNASGWQRIVDVHGGKLPIRLKAVPEGTVVSMKNILMLIESTDEQLPWITNFFETLLFQAEWYGTDVATVSFHIKKLINFYAEKTGTKVHEFHLNDFGYRGASSEQTAGIGGAGHLVNFLGTDNFAGIRYAMMYYGADVCGFSVAATEHSIVELYGKEKEIEAYRNFIKAFPESATLSSVSDTYDYKKCVSQYICVDLKEEILSRSGVFVVRPDSGFPPDIAVWTLQTLWAAYGGTVNEKGYRVLDPHLRMIYGDGINYNMINSILFAITLAGFSVDNIIFGMGGALLQQVNRDDFKMAIKACFAIINGDGVEVWKETITDPTKASKRGELMLVKINGEYKTIKRKDNIDNLPDELVTIFENGHIVKEYTFDEVRANARASFDSIPFALVA